ncbi:MAG: carboxypeptidase regulatory-like domain-containing protein [Gemmatimonadales bacterium]|jgi:hypothetical protein
MKENRGTWLRAARVLLATAVLSFGASGLWAQGTTGKVQGTVLDPTGQPVANAQVFIEGTSFAALTNEDGFYFFNNVPAGTYSMRAQFIGYQPAQVTDVRVLAGQTLTVDFGLAGAVQLEVLTVTAAAAPIVPRDQVASKAIVAGEDVDRLPVNDALNLVQLQPGVVTARGGNLSIRGSRANEAVIFIDGSPVRRMDTGASNLQVATNLLAEVSVTTGALEASFGDAQAGVISLVSRSGGPGFTGTLAYESDEMMGKSLTTGFNRFEAALAGPLLGNLTFALGGTLTGNRGSVTRVGAEEIPTYTFAGVDTTVSQLVEGSSTDSLQRAIPRIIQWGGLCEDTDLNGDGVINESTPEDNYGYECQGRIRPYSFTTDVRANAKLQLTYGSGSRISLSGFTNQTWNMFAQSRMNQESSQGSNNTSNALILNWVQQVFRGAESELAFDLNLSYQTDRFANGHMVRAEDLDLRDPFLGLNFGRLDLLTDFDRFAPGVAPSEHLTRDPATNGYLLRQLETDEDWDAYIENVRYDRGTLRTYLDRFEIQSNNYPRLNAWGLTIGPSNYGVNTAGGNNSLLYERRYVGRANVDFQADRYNRFKFGAEGTVARLGRQQMSLNRKSFGNGYVGEPYKWAAFAQDRLDLGDVVLEFGLRYDAYDTRTVFPLVPGRIFTNPAFDETASVEDMTCPTAREDCDIYEYVWYNSVKHTAWAPRVRVSFPVTDRTGFRLSYAHQTQVPDMFNMYNGTNNDLANTNTNDQFGGDADFGKTIQFEFGIRHAFSPDMVLDIAAYNKDKVSDITYRILPFFDTFSDRVSNVNVLTNADFGNVRGVDVQLVRRLGNYFTGQLSYTFQNARSTGSDPTDYLNGLSRQPFGVLDERPEAPQFTLRTRDDRRHNIQGSFSLNVPSDFAPGSAFGALLRNVGLFGTVQVRSGLPYTQLVNVGFGQTSAGTAGLGATLAEPLQASETPWEKYFDLRVTKGLRLGAADFTLYADIRNVFNVTNTSTLFAETGDVVNEIYFENIFLQPQLLTMEQDARSSGVWTTFTKTDADGSNARTVGAIDLRSIDNACPGWAGGGGAISCVMLQRTERRFGNGDGLYDVEEQTAAITEFYNLGNSPSAFAYGQGRLVRLGLQLSF